MKLLNLPVIALLFAIMFTASSCEVIGDIFKAGIWTGIILVIIIVALVMWLIGKARGRK